MQCCRLHAQEPPQHPHSIHDRNFKNADVNRSYYSSYMCWVSRRHKLNKSLTVLLLRIALSPTPPPSSRLSTVRSILLFPRARCLTLMGKSDAMRQCEHLCACTCMCYVSWRVLVHLSLYGSLRHLISLLGLKFNISTAHSNIRLSR